MYTKISGTRLGPAPRDRERAFLTFTLDNGFDGTFFFFRDLLCLCSAFDVLFFPRTGWKTAESEIRCVFILFHNKSKPRVINSTMKNMFIYSENMASSDLIFKQFS